VLDPMEVGIDYDYEDQQDYEDDRTLVLVIVLVIRIRREVSLPAKQLALNPDSSKIFEIFSSPNLDQAQVLDKKRQEGWLSG
jgi:hypothetical protein